MARGKARKGHKRQRKHENILKKARAMTPADWMRSIELLSFGPIGCALLRALGIRPFEAYAILQKHAAAKRAEVEELKRLHDLES